MINFNCNIKVKHNFKNINAIMQKLPQTAKQGVAEYAIHLLGTNNNGIICEMVNTETKEIKGRIHTDQDKMPWSWFREFGTGTFAQLPHIGKTKHFIESRI